MTCPRSARRRRLAVVAACLMVTTGLTACTAQPEPKPFRPSLTWGPCPDDVEVTFLTAHQCGTLTVLANRTKPGHGTVKLLVAKVPPPAGATNPGVGTSFGADFGDAESVGGGIAAGAARVGRTGLQLEWRGSGPHSTPSLRCPEVDPLGRLAAAVRHDDPKTHEAFVAAIRQCAKRLRSKGIDPADYTATAMAQDIEDLRIAARIDRWAMGASYGTQSAVLFEYVHLFPSRVMAGYLDSPSFRGSPGSGGDAAALNEALDVLFEACDRSSTCRAAHPDLSGLWSRALEYTATYPLRGTGQLSGKSVAVLVDAPKLVRATRFTLGGEGAPLTALPRIIDDAAHGRLATELASLVAGDPMFCSGYRPQCRDARFSLGVFLTNLCEAVPPTGTGPESTRGPEPDHPSYPAVFADSPYVDACKAWNVPSHAPASAESLSGVPLLLLSGDLDSFSPLAATRAAARRLGPSVFVVGVPGGIHNVLGFHECAITARNTWTREPQLPPPVNACIDVRPVPFS
jgi:pimeloyl-ACP methyl ester carboxylesterase